MSTNSPDSVLRKGLEGVARGLGFAGRLALASMMVTICYDVVMRYVFKTPTSWSLEVNTFMVLFVTLIPAGDVLASGSHLRITFFTEKMSPQVQSGIAKIVEAVGCLFCGLMAWKGFEIAWMALKYDERMSSPLGTPMVIPYIFIPVGFGVMFLQYLVALCLPGTKPASMSTRRKL